MSIISRIWKKQDSPPALSFSRGQLPRFVKRSPTALRFYALLHLIDWKRFPERQIQAHWKEEATPYRAFVASYLLMLEEQLKSMSRLRLYLCEHPELVWLFGFTKKRRYDADKILPTARHFTRLLRKMPPECATFLLDETVRLLQEQLQHQDFGQAISLDTKHILAWVKENNPKAYVEERHNKEKQPQGDKDCKLGCKRRRNVSPELPTPSKNPQPASAIKKGIGEFYWGYASGVVATKVPELGEFVLAEYTQAFNCSDVSYFHPLMADTERRLGFRPRFGTFDAAFDAHYVYDYFHRDGTKWQHAFAAIPFSGRSAPRTFDKDGHPICEAGLSFFPSYDFISRATLFEHQRTHYVCPLKGQTEQACPIQHKRWAKGGCTHRIPTSMGARLRHFIDRESELYKHIYKQRTATERINSQAKALGIERPKLRNQQAITNRNTLIYVLINLRGLQRIQTRL
ncbi:MAG: hypothetical protein Phog2KO_25460 [Phototrophicaceae bacterium]